MATPNRNDEMLARLLRQWKAPEPGPWFEQQVTRRIHTPPPARTLLADWLLFHPGLVRVAAALPAIVLGAWLGYVTAIPSSASVGVLSGGSISGQYAQLVTGGLR